MQRTILIAGPTASGKSALALALAERFGGVVVNADSMQVYRDLAVLTARPSGGDLARAGHELYGTVDGAVAYSVGRWLEDVAPVLAQLWAADAVPIIVGGTGLYFRALTEGLSPIPAVPPDIRDHWRGEAARLGPAALHEVLGRRDAETARRLRPTDPQRIVRALEVLDATGWGLAQWQGQPGRPVVPEAGAVKLVAGLDRATLYARADDRVDAMLAGGAIAEVRLLASRGLAPDLPVMRALGVAPLLRLLAGEIALADAAALTKAETRRYIKRQQTWLRRNMITWDSVSAIDMERIFGGDFTLIRS